MFSDDRYDRVSHSLGKAYRDVVRGFRGEFPNPPDLVAYPESAEDVDVVLNFCADEGAAAIPYGGGTSVVGGVEPRMRGDYPAVITIDLKRMDRVLEVDPISMAARIQAGATGPRLEEQLREHGLTLRHFPQSFEYSTLGGWIATRAGGHFATLYTHFDDLAAGAGAVREISQSGLNPSNCRLLDAVESATSSAGPVDKAMLVLGFESAHHPVEDEMTLAIDAARAHGGEPGEIKRQAAE